MPYRKTYILTKHRITQDVLRKLQHAAIRDDRSVSEEIGRRLEDSFRIEKERQQMAKEREQIAKEREQIAREREELAKGRERTLEVLQGLVTAMGSDLQSDPVERKATRAALGEIEEYVERGLQNEPDIKALFSGEEGES
jgi:hypothetical protein